MLCADRGRAALPGSLAASGRQRIASRVPARRRAASRLLPLAAAGSGGASGGEGAPAAAGNLWQQLRSGAKSLWRSLQEQPEQQGGAGAAGSTAAAAQQGGVSGSVQQGGPGRSQTLSFRPDASAASSMDDAMVEGHVDVAPPAAPVEPVAAAAVGEVAAAAPQPPPVTADALLSWDAPEPAAGASAGPASSGDGGEGGWAPQAGPSPPPKPWARTAAGETPCPHNGVGSHFRHLRRKGRRRSYCVLSRFSIGGQVQPWDGSNC